MLAKTIEKLLNEYKVTKTELSNHLGIYRTTLDDYLKGKTFMPSDKIIKTAEFFGVTVGYLFGEKADPEKEKSDIMKLLIEQQKQINEIKLLINERTTPEKKQGKTKKIP